MALNLKTETVLTGETRAPQPALPPEQIAALFPQFVILECLGRGGMGVVYKARQKSLDRLVALKILAPEREKDPEFAERFAREAKTLAQLNHPNIVTVHDFGETGEMFYLVMEFVDGVNLRHLLGDSRLAPEAALAIVPPICEALQYAHERGVVHRDIKPENLLLERTGRIKIADFGVAKILGRAGPGSGEAEQQQVVGTPRYMAPEQVEQPLKVDHRADIYSLGVVLYEMLTGELPAKPIDAPSRKIHMDVRIDEIVLRALEKKPERRYQTAHQFKTYVETLAIESNTTTPKREPLARPSESWLQSFRRNRKFAAGALAVTAALLIVAAATVVPNFFAERSGQDSAGLRALPTLKGSAVAQRVLYFPADRSLGALFTRSARTNWALDDLLSDWKEFSDARGKVEIPAGEEARLDVSAEGAKDLSPLASLAPDALRAVLFLRSQADEQCLKQIGRLTGLKYLRLQDDKVTDQGIAHCAGLRELVCLSADTTRVGDKGMKTIGGLRSLQRLQLAYTPISDQGLAELVGLKSLRYLRLDRTAITDAGIMHLQNLSELREVRLAETAITDKSLDYLNKLPNLEELDLNSTAISDRNLGAVKRMSRLKSLSLTRTEVTDAGLTQLAALKALEELTVPARITDEGIKRLNGLRSLKKLDLTGTEVTGKCLASLKDLPAVRRLCLSGRIEDGDLTHLHNFPRLEELWLQNAPITDSGIAHVAAIKSLKELFLGRLQVTDAAYAMLKQLPALEYLYLMDQGRRNNYQSGISDKGLAHVSQISTLRYLDVSRSRVTDLGLAELKRLPRLESLNLEGTRVRGEGLAELREMRTLKEVILGNTDISSAGVDALLSLPSLEFLSLQRIKIAPDDLLRLQAGISSAKLLISLASESQPPRLKTGDAGRDDAGAVNTRAASAAALLPLTTADIISGSVNEILAGIGACMTSIQDAAAKNGLSEMGGTFDQINEYCDQLQGKNQNTAPTMKEWGIQDARRFRELLSILAALENDAEIMRDIARDKKRSRAERAALLNGWQERLTTKYNGLATVLVAEMSGQQAAAIANVPSPGFGPIIERILYDEDANQSKPSMIDLDSGKVFEAFTSEQPFIAAFEAGLKRMRNEGIDLISDSSGKSFVGFEMTLLPSEQSFEQVTAEGITKDKSLAATAATEVSVTVQKLPATYVFQTREGGRGVLEVLRFSTNYDSMDFRYRLLDERRAGASEDPAGTPIDQRARSTPNDPREKQPTAQEIRSVTVDEWFRRIGKDSEFGYAAFTALNALVRKSKQSDEIRDEIIRKAIAIIDDPLENDFRRWQCCYVLSGVGDKRGIPAIARALNYESEVVRGVAACALGQFEDSDGRAILQAAAKNEKNSEVHETIQKALNGEFRRKN